METEQDEEAEGDEEAGEAEEAGVGDPDEAGLEAPEDGEDGVEEAPPSYSKAVSLERLSLDSPDGSAGRNHMAVSPDDSRSDRLESSILPPLTHELTASELLLNK